MGGRVVGLEAALGDREDEGVRGGWGGGGGGASRRVRDIACAIPVFPHPQMACRRFRRHAHPPEVWVAVRVISKRRASAGCAEPYVRHILAVSRRGFPAYAAHVARLSAPRPMDPPDISIRP